MVKTNGEIPSLSRSLKLTSDRELFENISLAKKAFVTLFSKVGNEFSDKSLDPAHRNHKGIKISQGNELQHCPYQVLDIIRDFDARDGLNIRVLHWWGRGIYLFIFLGNHHPYLKSLHPLFRFIKHREYGLCKNSLWAYKEIIDKKDFLTAKSIEQHYLADHLNSGIPFQLVKKIPTANAALLDGLLINEIDYFLSWVASRHF
jgi:hypothetical protein